MSIKCQHADEYRVQNTEYGHLITNPKPKAKCPQREFAGAKVRKKIGLHKFTDGKVSKNYVLHAKRAKMGSNDPRKRRSDARRRGRREVAKLGGIAPRSGPAGVGSRHAMPEIKTRKKNGIEKLDGLDR